MTTAEANLAPDGDLVLEITRIFSASRELVFKVFTDPSHTIRWMGPKEFPASHVEADVRPGGKWHVRLKASDAVTDQRRGVELGQGGVYREVVPPERLVWTSRWDAEPWNPNPEANRETVITATFAELKSGKTKMVFRQEVFDTKSNRDGHVGGWNSAFDRLDTYLASLS